MWRENTRKKILLLHAEKLYLVILSGKTVGNISWNKKHQTNKFNGSSCHIHHLHNTHIVYLYICIPCIQVMSMCLPSICMSVQTVEVCVHVEMQLQLIYDLNTANTHFIISVCGTNSFKTVTQNRKFALYFISQRNQTALVPSKLCLHNKNILSTFPLWPKFTYL